MADVSVRPARPSDSAAVARVQRTTWHTAYGDQLPPEALSLEESDLETMWSQAISSPPSPQHRVLVALDGDQVAGFATCEPTDDGAELTNLLVEPRWGRRGHGSRLLTATVDLWREDGVAVGTTWVFEDDAVVARFLESAGWRPETVGRSLESGATVVRQRRWHTAL